MGSPYDWIISVLPEPTVLVSADGRVVSTNPAMVEFACGTLDGQPLEIFTDPPGHLREYLRVCSGVRELLPAHLKVRCGEGTPLDIRCEAAIVSPPGAPEPVFLLRIKSHLEAVDKFRQLNEQIDLLNAEISQRKAVEEELRKAQGLLAEHAAELEKRVQERTADLRGTIAELEAFSYSLSHDIRAPLRAIQSYVDIALIEYNDALGKGGADLLGRVRSAGARLDRLVQDVLTYTRAAQMPLALVPVNVEALLREVIHERPDLQMPQAAVEIEGRFPLVLGHDACLTQCFSNLIDNAVKFVAPQTLPKVRIWGEEVNGRVRISIQDNGIGIPPEAHPRMFRLFEKHHSNGAYPGSGIGLSIVRKAAERMGGQVSFQSELGKGSRFWIELAKAPQDQMNGSDGVAPFLQQPALQP